MIEITIVNHRNKNYYQFETEREALNFMNELIDEAIELERQYLDDIEEDDLKAIEKIKELEKLDKDWIYTLENNVDLIIGEYVDVEIVEYDYYITDLLTELGYVYDKSTVSKSIYVENNEGLLIRISDHNTPNITKDYGHKISDVELIYRDGVINNEDINRYFNTNLKDEIILL